MRQASTRKISDEVFYSDGQFMAADQAVVDMLKASALTSPRKRCRLCFHPDQKAAQQEMLIVMHKSSYVRPHRHFGKTETLTVIEGASDALVFSDNGSLEKVVAMSVPKETGSFFYRMPEGVFHSLIFKSEWFVFLETTAGPFDRTQSEQASWAPPETDPSGGHRYLKSLKIGNW